MVMLAAHSQVRDDSFKGKTFVGIVVDNNDPEKLQRCRVRCRGVHQGMDDKSLPWAMKGQAPGGDVKRVDVPPLGTEVMLKFQDDTLYNPIYYGTRQTKATVNEELTSTNYPHQINEIDRTGSKFVRDTKTDSWEYTHVSGTQVTFDGKGHFKLVIADKSVGPDATSTVPNGITIEVQGPFNIICKEDINIKSKQSINLEALQSINFRAPKVNTNDQAPNVPDPAVPTARTRPEEKPFVGQTDYGDT